ncbi:MAG: DMT family transporter [Cyanobacteria bacterium J06639_16]
MTMTMALRKANFTEFTPTPRFTAILALLIAQLAIAIGVFFIKISVAEIGALSTIFNRCWIAGLVFFCCHQSALLASNLVHYKPENANRGLSPLWKDNTSCESDSTIKAVVLLLITGIIWVTCLVLWAVSLEHTNVANSTLMHDLSPLFAMILGWLFFKHQFSRQFLIAVGITLMGVMTIGFEELHIGLDHLLGDGLGLLSAAFLALYCLLVEHLRSKLSFAVILQWVCWFGSLSLIPLICLTSGTFHPVSSLGWLAIAGAVVFAQIIGQGLTAFSLKTVSSELASLFFPLEAVFVAVLAWIKFGEHLTGLNCLGFGLVLAGIYVALLSPPEITQSHG